MDIGGTLAKLVYFEPTDLDPNDRTTEQENLQTIKHYLKVRLTTPHAAVALSWAMSSLIYRQFTDGLLRRWHLLREFGGPTAYCLKAWAPSRRSHPLLSRANGQTRGVQRTFLSADAVQRVDIVQARF